MTNRSEVDPNTVKKTLYKQKYYSDQVNVNYNEILTGRSGNDSKLVGEVSGQKTRDDTESLNFYEQRLNYIKNTSDSKDKKSKSLNYNSNKSTETSGQKRKETLENIKDYLGQIEQTKIKEQYSSNYEHCTNNKNVELENKRMKLNENSKKYILEKMQELNYKNALTHREGNKPIPSANLYKKNRQYNIKK